MRVLRYGFPLLVLVAATGGTTSAAGLLIPEDKKLPPLAMVHHRVAVEIIDQVAVTTVEQTFRNHTDRPLEATYLFPVPKGASVDRFTMWVDGKETGGELLDSKKAHAVYTDIVRRTQDPGLLEYLGNNLMRLRVFPVPPKGDQKVKLSYKSVAPQDAGVIEYVYPLKTDGKATSTLEDFSVKISLKSQRPLANVYSPTHAITVTKKGDKEATVEFARDQAMLDKDFQLFYGFANKDIGVTPLLYKPITAEDGYFMMLISPQVEAEKVRVARDLVLVLDTSSSMSELKMAQAKKALKFCLSQLGPDDRFGLVKFSTSVVKFRDALVPANKDYLERAHKWVDDLRVSGGTAIWPALDEALALRPNDAGRPFTLVFFTDGMPTVDETNPDKIVKNVAGKNSAQTRIFTFGVGDDVNASMLDQLADATRAVSTYVRPAEDIETKVASLYGKISHPVLTDVRIATGGDVKLHEIYPPKLPDLFHGTQLVVIGRYSGQGHTAVKLTGKVGGETREFVYEVTFPEKTDAGKEFVEPLWARRKVGYLLDQIRANGEQKELVEEVTAIARKYGIATPYTSYLVVPDGPMPVVPPTRLPGSGPGGPVPLPGPIGGFGGGAAGGGAAGGRALKVEDFAKGAAGTPMPQGSPAAKPGDTAAQLGAARGAVTEKQTEDALRELRDKRDGTSAGLATELRRFQEQKKVLDQANNAFKSRDKSHYQSGQLGVDLSICANNLRCQDRLSLTANRQVRGRNCLEVNGVWIDDAFKADTKTLVVKAQSEAYFRILEKRPEVKDVYRLGNHVVWVAPSGCALVIDTADGKEKLDDAEIDALFAAKK